MKLHHQIFTALCLLLGTSASAESYTDIDVSNDATIAGAISFGRVQIGNTAATGTAHGMKIHVTQTAQEVWLSSTKPGFWQDNYVSVDVYGTIYVGGYALPIYEWGVVGTDYFPEVTGSELVTPAVTEPIYERRVVDTIHHPAVTETMSYPAEYDPVSGELIRAAYTETTTITPAYDEPVYGDVIVGYRTVSEAVYQTYVISPARNENRYGNVWVRDDWVPGTPTTGIIGTEQQNRPIWVPEEVVPYSEMRYNAPVIHQTATRSDSNWTWEVPNSSGAAREVMRLWQGGVTLPDASGQVNMALTPTTLNYSQANTVPGVETSNSSVQHGAVSSLHVTNATMGALSVESKAEVRSDLVRLTRTESGTGSQPIKMTQISAQSANFGGAVDVAGNVNVGGVLRIKAQGDLDMGEFTQGTAP